MPYHLGGRRFCKKKVGLRQPHFLHGVIVGVVPIFALAFSASFLASSILAPINTSNAAEIAITANVTYGAYSISLSTDSSINLNLNADRNGVMTVGTSNVTTTTSSPNGYQLYLSMTGTHSDTNSLINTTTPTSELTSSGTFTNPVALTNGTWGYAIPSGTDTLLDTNGFDASYATVSSASPNSNKFASIPTDEPQLIAETDSANTTANVLPVFYGARVGFETAVGSYTNKILYTAIADSGSSSTLYVSPDETPALDGGELLTLTTTLVTSTQNINADAYLLTQSQYTAVTREENPVDVKTLTSAKMTYTGESSCIRTPDMDILQLQCIAPAMAAGDYYIYVDLPDYGLHYDRTFSYVKNFYNITTMQEMTADICNDIKYAVTPKATIFNGTNIYGQTGTATEANNADTGNSLYRPNHPNDPNYVPQHTLYDIRNNESYNVRKLADGNCWMTENLRLEFDGTSTTGLTADDSDIASTYTASNPLIIGATQPYNQPETGTIDGVAYDRYNWGVASDDDLNESTVDRWLSRSTKKDGVWTTETTPVQSGAPTADLTREDQKTGVYYNWYTATAGTGNWSISTGGVTADSSICPKGWYLPRYDNNTTKSWMYLIRNVYHIVNTSGDQSTLPDGNPSANATLHGFPLSLPYSGYVSYQSGATNSQGTFGRFWSAGSTSQLYARGLSFYGSTVNSGTSARRLYGFAIRCIAKQPENQ